MIAASGSFLTGMNNYLVKLGPDNLGVDGNSIEWHNAASFPASMSRIRLQDMARLLADGLALQLARKRDRPVCLVNIAGGPAADSWNAVIHLHRLDSASLKGRRIVIAVFDIDHHGPTFGSRALAALCAPSCPLSRLEINFRFIEYEWAEADRLLHALEGVCAEDAICAISSEGGLFEHGSDHEITANLKKLHIGTASDAILVGSVTRDGEPVRSFQRASRVATRPRTIEAFGRLAERAGWIVERVIEQPFSYNVSRVKAQL